MDGVARSEKGSEGERGGRRRGGEGVEASFLFSFGV